MPILPKRRDHANLGFFQSRVNVSRPRALPFSVHVLVFYNIQGLPRVSRCAGQRSERPANRAPQAESPTAPRPPGVRCRFFGNEGKSQRPDVPVTPSPDRATRWGIVRAAGGEGGIRTHDTLARIPVFETGTFNRSVTSPICARILQRGRSTRGIDGLE